MQNNQNQSVLSGAPLLFSRNAVGFAVLAIFFIVVSTHLLERAI